LLQSRAKNNNRRSDGERIDIKSLCFKYVLRKKNKSETQTRREVFWVEAIWGLTDGLTDGPTDEVYYRGAMLAL
jgi:hypothetical protein